MSTPQKLTETEQPQPDETLEEAAREKRKALIKSIRPNAANFDFCRDFNIVNGSLSIDIHRCMKEYAEWVMQKCKRDKVAESFETIAVESMRNIYHVDLSESELQVWIDAFKAGAAYIKDKMWSDEDMLESWKCKDGFMFEDWLTQYRKKNKNK